MSLSPHRQRPDLAVKCLRRLESELADRGTPLRARPPERSEGRERQLAESRLRRVVIEG